MTELELQERFCENCENPDCMRCAAFAAHYESENDDDDIEVPSLSDREKYDLQCEINETAADLYMNF